jgi:hypothetical protein
MNAGVWEGIRQTSDIIGKSSPGNLPDCEDSRHQISPHHLPRFRRDLF